MNEFSTKAAIEEFQKKEPMVKPPTPHPSFLFLPTTIPTTRSHFYLPHSCPCYPTIFAFVSASC